MVEEGSDFFAGEGGFKILGTLGNVAVFVCGAVRKGDDFDSGLVLGS